MADLIERIRKESDRSAQEYGLYHSTHEGYGVLAEEVAELLEAIRKNDAQAVDHEAVQVAAVAYGIARACRNAAFAKRSGFEKPLL